MQDRCYPHFTYVPTSSCTSVQRRAIRVASKDALHPGTRSIRRRELRCLRSFRPCLPPAFPSAVRHCATCDSAPCALMQGSTSSTSARQACRQRPASGRTCRAARDGARRRIRIRGCRESRAEFRWFLFRCDRIVDHTSERRSGRKPSARCSPSSRRIRSNSHRRTRPRRGPDTGAVRRLLLCTARHVTGRCI